MSERATADEGAAATPPGGGGGAPPPPPAVRSEGQFLSVLGQFAVMQAVLSGSSLVRNKIVAYRLGPGAFGEYAQLSAVVALASTFVCFGMGVSLSRNVARAESHGERQRYLENANGMVLALTALALAVAVALLPSGRLLRLAGLTPSTGALLAAAIFVAGVPVEAVKNNHFAVLQGLLDVRSLATRRSAGALVGTVFAVPLVWYLGLVGAALQSLVAGTLVAFLLGWRCHRLGYAALRVRLDRPTVALLGSFGAASVVNALAQGFSDTAVRAHLISTMGAEANGLLQAPYVLSQTLKTVILSSIGTVALAGVPWSASREEVSATLGKLLNVVVPLGASAIGLLGLLGVPTLTILYSSSFAPGARLFPWVLSADLLLVVGWVLAAPLLAYGDRVLWLALDLLFALVRWAVALLLVRDLGAVGVTVGLLVGVAVQVAIGLYLFRARYRLSVAASHGGAVAAGVALVAGLSAIGSQGLRSVPLAVGGAALWAAYTLYYAVKRDVFSAVRRRLGRA